MTETFTFQSWLHKHHTDVSLNLMHSIYAHQLFHGMCKKSRQLSFEPLTEYRSKRLFDWHGCFCSPTCIRHFYSERHTHHARRILILLQRTLISSVCMRKKQSHVPRHQISADFPAHGRCSVLFHAQSKSSERSLRKIISRAHWKAQRRRVVKKTF